MRTTVKEKITPQKKKEYKVRLPADLKNALQQAGCLLLSLLLSRTVIAGDMSPFGIAFCAAVQPKYMISALVGSGAGVFLSASVLSPYRYLGAIIGAVLLSWAVFSFGSRKLRQVFPGIAAFACCLFTGLVMCGANGFPAEEAMVCFAESVLCGGSAYFFHRTMAAASAGQALRTLPLNGLVPVAVSFSILLVSLQWLDAGAFSPARVLAVFVILVAARYGGVTGGALTGVLLGLCMGLGGEQLFLTGVYGVGGLMAGAFYTTGQAGSCAAFLASSLVMLAMNGGAMELLPLLLEIAAAALVFLLLPQKLCNRIDHIFNTNLDISPSGSLRDSLVVKLRFAGNTMSGISQSINSVNEKLRELAVPPSGTLSKHLAQEVCATCNLKTLCWKKEGAETLDGFRGLWNAARDEGRLTRANLPSQLEERCIHTDQLIRSYNIQYREFCRQEQFENSVGHLREIVAEQLEGMSDMLFDLSAEFEQAEIYDLEAAEKIKRIFQNYGVCPRDVCCITDKYQRIRVEAHCSQPVDRVHNRTLHREVAAVCGRRFADVNVTFAGHEALLTYCEKPRLTLFVGTAQHASGGNTVCGDCIEVLEDGKGHQVLILSDGMGTGKSAAIEGALAAGMLARLLKGGFGFDCSLRTVNSALLVKSGEESLATLDVVSVDLFNGRTEFFKAGASASFVVKEGKAWKVELPSLPAGILREVEFAKTSAFLHPGDKLVLFTDGIADSETGWLAAFLERESACTPQSLAEKILKEAQRRSQALREDDMTVLVAEMAENS